MGIFRHRRAVELITQAALGATMGELMLGKRLGKRAMAWGALFGVLPAVDVILSLFFDTAHQLVFRQGPSHSLWLMGLASYGLAHLLEKRWKRENITKAQAGCFVFVLFCGHVLLECFPVSGAGVLWPFVGARQAFNDLFPTDFLLSAPLIVVAVWLAVLPEDVVKKTRGKKAAPPSKRRRLGFWGIGLASAYVLLSVGMKFVASGGFEADLKRRGTVYQKRMEAPTMFNLFLWRSVVDRGDEMWVGYRTIFESHETPVRWTVYPKGTAALAGVADMREIKTLTRLTDGWWLARTNAKGVWLGDLRHCEARNWGDKKSMVDSRMAYSWVFSVTAKGDRLRQIDETWRNTGETLSRMSGRIIGKREQWEANPRLAGVAGSLPEFLPVEE
ncbi:MAG: metal-dependent hydrolase [Luteolibacter sp.]